MIVFKTFWRIMKRYWWIVFIYVAILTSLSIINLKTAPVTDFVDTKPEITIVSQNPQILPLSHSRKISSTTYRKIPRLLILKNPKPLMPSSTKKSA